MKPPRHNVPRIKTNILPAEGAFDFTRPIPAHTSPLARYLEKYMVDGTIAVEPGCGIHPVAVEIIKQARDRLSGVRIIGIDLFDGDEDAGRLQKKEDDEIGEGRFLVVTRDVNTLYPGSLEIIKDDCRQRLQEFLGGMDINKARIGMLILSGIAHVMSWDRPLDFLLNRVDTNGTVILAGLPDGTNKIRFEGRELKDLAGHLTEEGYELVDHVFTGNAMTTTMDGLKTTFLGAVRKTVDAEFAANEQYRRQGLQVPIDEFSRKIRGSFERELSSRGQFAVWPADKALIQKDKETVHYDRVHRMEKGAHHDWRVHGDYCMPHLVLSKDGREALGGDHEVFVLRKTERVKPLEERGAVSKFFRQLLGLGGQL